MRSRSSLQFSTFWLSARRQPFSVQFSHTRSKLLSPTTPNRTFWTGQSPSWCLDISVDLVGLGRKHFLLSIESCYVGVYSHRLGYRLFVHPKVIRKHFIYFDIFSYVWFLVPGHAPSSQQNHHENQCRSMDIFDSQVYQRKYLKDDNDFFQWVCCHA